MKNILRSLYNKVINPNSPFPLSHRAAYVRDLILFGLLIGGIGFLYWLFTNAID